MVNVGTHYLTPDDRTTDPNADINKIGCKTVSIPLVYIGNCPIKWNEDKSEFIIQTQYLGEGEELKYKTVSKEKQKRGK